MPTNIKKLYLSNFLIGLMFWYGIEKLFMKSIGIDAAGVGILTAMFLGFNLIFAIPTGVLADKWSRKGVIFISIISLALCSLILGLSNDFAAYFVGYIFFAVYLVAATGIYQALVYDCLHEFGLAHHYSKIMGRAYALFLLGVGIANLASGFLAAHYNYRTTFYISIVPCLINMVVILSVREPLFHKDEQRDRPLLQIKHAFTTISRTTLIRGLAVMIAALAIIEIFKLYFGQLYMIRYVPSAEMLGILWAGYAFTVALGSFMAHKLRSRMNLLVFAYVLPLIFMCFIDNWFGIVLFMIQAVAGAALLNQIETRVQESTPSAVRASTLSVLNSMGRFVSMPASIGIGWLIRIHNVLWALYAMTCLAVLILIYWLWLRNRLAGVDTRIVAEPSLATVELPIA